MLVKKYKFLSDVGDNVSGFVSINLYSLKDIYFLYFPGFLGEEVDRKVHNIKNTRKRTLEEPEYPPAKGRKGSPRLIFTRYPPSNESLMIIHLYIVCFCSSR